jgi:hypothetical protein
MQCFQIAQAYFAPAISWVREMFMKWTPQAKFLSQLFRLFPACPRLWTNFLEEFLIALELKLLSHKVPAQLIHNSCLAHLQMTKNTK